MSRATTGSNLAHIASRLSSLASTLASLSESESAFSGFSCSSIQPAW